MSLVHHFGQVFTGLPLLPFAHFSSGKGSSFTIRSFDSLDLKSINVRFLKVISTNCQPALDRTIGHNLSTLVQAFNTTRAALKKVSVSYGDLYSLFAMQSGLSDVHMGPQRSKLPFKLTSRKSPFITRNVPYNSRSSDRKLSLFGVVLL